MTKVSDSIYMILDDIKDIYLLVVIEISISNFMSTHRVSMHFTKHFT